MKKFPVLFILLLISPFIFGQVFHDQLKSDLFEKTAYQNRTDDSVLDSTLYYFPDSITGAWELQAKKYFSYDTNNVLVGETILFSNNGNWENQQQLIYTYDAADNLTSSTLQSWDGNYWNNLYRSQYSFNSLNLCVSETNMLWDSSSWENSGQVLFYYNSLNAETGSLSKTWDGNNWLDQIRSTNSFDVNNNKIQNLVEQYSSGSWVPNIQHLFNYNILNNCTTEIQQVWNGSTWTNNHKYTFDYDLNNNRILDLLQRWNSVWVNKALMNSVFDNDNHRINYKISSWDTLTSSFTNFDSAHFFYHDVNVGINETKMKIFMNVYPNPTNGNTNIRFSTEQQNTTISIYDLQGKQINSIIFSGSNLELKVGLQPGIYFVQAISEDGDLAARRKLIVL